MKRSTISNWFRFLGFTYRERVKCYSNDKHENEETLQARDEFITQYFTLELRVHHWVQVPTGAAITLAEDYGIIDAYHKFNRRGEEYREYHVDTHPILFKYVKDKHMGEMCL